MPTTNKLVTYIITTWNRKDTLRHHLLRMSMQTWDKPFEIIVCVDGSTDGTQMMLKYWDSNQCYRKLSKKRGKASRYTLQWFDTENTNITTPAQSRNNGIKHANGEVIIFSDDDCLPHNQLIESYMAKYNPKEVQIGYRSSLREYLDCKLPCLIEPGKMKEYEECQKNGTIRAGHFTTGSCCMSRDLSRIPTRKGGEGFDERFNGYGFEDCELADRIDQIGIKFVWNPDAIVWHMNPSATNQQNPEKKKEELEKNRNLYYKILNEPYEKRNQN